MTHSFLYLYPLTLSILLPMAVFLSFAIAYGLGHLQPKFFHYIADTGTQPPEQCFFSQLLNMACFAYLGVVYIRYKQIQLFYISKYKKKKSRKNIAGLVTGIVSFFGACIVANFQKSNVYPIHAAGTFLGFVGGCTWFCFQTYFSILMLPLFGNKRVAYFRLVLCIMGFLMYGVFQPCSIYASVTSKSSGKLWRNGNTNTTDHYELGGHTSSYGKDATWTAKTTAVVFEWLLLAVFEMYIITLIPEFRVISYIDPIFYIDGVNESDLPNEGRNTRSNNGLSISLASSTNETTTPARIVSISTFQTHPNPMLWKFSFNRNNDANSGPGSNIFYTFTDKPVIIASEQKLNK